LFTVFVVIIKLLISFTINQLTVEFLS